MKFLINLVILCIFACNLLLAKQAFCFDDKNTHPEITQVGIKYSGINSYLINVLGFTTGTEDKIKPNTLLGIFNNKSILKWLQTGSTEEDDPLCRASTHFHDPNKTWDLSFVTDSPWLIERWCQNFPPTWNQYSNIYWATGQLSRTAAVTSREKQQNGWDNAREYFYSALTTSEPANREDYFVKTFTAVGHLMHLLQDVAVPAHVRNDFQSHVNFAGIDGNSPVNPLSWFGNEFEYYVKLNGTSLITAAIPSFPASPASITDLWDTTDTVPNPLPSAGDGLAEITSREFFSDETIPGNSPTAEHTYAQPQIDPFNTCLVQHPGALLKSMYVSRTPCNGPPKYIALKSLVSSPNKKMYQLDDTVFESNAKELLPRAVGYSAALLDYFFRGKLDLQIAEGTTFRTINLTAQNTTANNETMSPGEVSLVIRYKEMTESGSGPLRTLNFAPDEYQYRVITLPGQNSIPRDSSVQLSFDLSADPLPLHIGDITLQLVYKGKLGNEEGAVAVGSVSLPAIGTNIGITLPSSGVFAKTIGSSFTGIDLIAESSIPGALTGGNTELVLEYQLATSDPFISQPVDSEPQTALSYIIRVPAVTGGNTLTGGVPVELHFDLSAAPLPLWATDVYLNVIYRRTGDPESKPVAVGYRDISEPTPLDVFNNADMVCIDNTWHPAGTPATLALKDAGGNLLAEQADLYAHNIANIFAKASASGSTALASPTNFTFSSAAPLTSGSPRRLGYILSDYTINYSYQEEWQDADETDPWVMAKPTAVFTGIAVKNQTDSAGNYIWPAMYTIRGNKMWGGAGVVWDNEAWPEGANAFDSCGWNTLP